MNCDELLKAMNDFVDGDVEPGVCEEFEKHLSGCNPCQIVVDNIRKTITLYQDGEPYPLPEDFHSKLCGKLRTRWREKFGC
jgi:hypothetical protein